ncbi:MAG: peptidoglycan DD-metalloendopeptidase family protein [Eggerthellaceae bacterium]|nr:peptidoglycan DD-metalloendopeptidase family protein [Eggerthellaceae bacterium]
MTTTTHHTFTIALGLAICALACAFSCMFPTPASAVTAAEKQEEADAVWAQIDSLQTSINAAMARYNSAMEARDEAIAQRDAAAQRVAEESARIEYLQGKLADFAIASYKQGGNERFLEVLLGTTSFEDFMTTWDAVNAISDQGRLLIQASQEARAREEAARATFQQQSEIAEQQMFEAEATRAQIAETQAALIEEAEKITAEAAELQAQEELAAEAARQAAEAAAAREAALAAAQQSYYSNGPAEGAGASVLIGSGYFTNPLPNGVLSSGFGYRTFDYSFHKGIDLAAAEGTPYYAADSGTVIYATYDGGYNGGAGNWIVITHGNGIVTKYMHSSAVYVSVGEYVERGQNIGAVGNTGNSFGAHLHFQVEVDGVAINPLNFL